MSLNTVSPMCLSPFLIFALHLSFVHNKNINLLLKIAPLLPPDKFSFSPETLGSGMNSWTLD